MHIKILAVGRLKEKYWQAALREYQKRLERYHRLELIEVADEPDPEHGGEAAIADVRAREGERLRRRIDPRDHLICLDIAGEHFDSPGLARRLERLDSRGTTRLTLVIGGSNGIDPALLAEADERWSFSDLTFPHQLMRIILLEQLYRATRISRGEPYHK